MTEATKIAVEQVYGDYHRGRYGDFNVIVRITDGYVNITNLGNNNRFASWIKRLDELKTGSYLGESKMAISRLTGIPVAKLTEAVSDGDHDMCGMYAHPDLVPHIASWVSPDFAMRVSRTANAVMVCEHDRQLCEKNVTIDDLTRKMEELIAKQDAMAHDLRGEEQALVLTRIATGSPM